MKRLSTALAPTLMTGALLGISAISMAQSNTLSLVGNIPESVARGSTFTLTLTGSTDGAETLATTFQALFRFDPAYLDVNFAPGAAFPLSEVANNVLRTVNVTSGEHQGMNVMKQSTYGISAATNGRHLDPNTVLGTFTIRWNDNAPGGFTDLGLSNAVIHDFTLASNRRSTITSTPAQGTVFGGDTIRLGRPGAFRVGTVPGPSSLAIFALGGLAPAMAILRRRRAAK
jgi:hypothetical protein